ncbi:small integral membrane protein 28-like [Arapaima gigas]
MRILLESSWMKFGPAGRGSYDWVTGTPSTPVEKQLQGHHWKELNPNEETEPELIFYIFLPAAFLLFISLLILLLYKYCSRRKQGLASLLEVSEDDIESFPGAGSDASDGVFLMVYLPPPYEESLTKLTRAASCCSSKDVASAVRVAAEDLGAKL